jgi:hypothetical protein
MTWILPLAATAAMALANAPPDRAVCLAFAEELEAIPRRSLAPFRMSSRRMCRSRHPQSIGWAM